MSNYYSHFAQAWPIKIYFYPTMAPKETTEATIVGWRVRPNGSTYPIVMVNDGSAHALDEEDTWKVVQ